MSILNYRISESDTYGRYLVADRDIAAGEVILGEEPVIVGPSNTNKRFVCFACMKSIFNVNFICTKCKVASVCSDICVQWKAFHSEEECDLFKNCKHSIRNNLSRLTEILMHLRLWLIRKQKPKVWEEIRQMEAHLEERRKQPVWDSVKFNVIETFKEFGFISSEDNESLELLQWISGILDVNTFEIRSQTEITDAPLRGLYLEPSLMAHNCLSNTHLTVDDTFRLRVFASVPIKEGEMICFNYTSPLMGFMERQIYLLEGKYFQCKCALCQDPTEGGSNISTILCSKCKKGYMNMQNTLGINSYNKLIKWKCQMCDRDCSSYFVRSILNISKDLVDESEDNIEKLEELLKKLSTSLHTNHFIMLTLKQKLLACYKQEIESSYADRHYLLRMIELSKELLSVINIMEPGISRLKGILLYEMFAPMITLANREYTLQEITLDELINKLEEGRNILRKSLSMILLEPLSSPEGLLAKEAIQKLKNLNQNIKDVESLPRN